MRALLCRETTGPDGLEVAEIAEPEPGPGEIAIAVEGCGVNFADTLIVEGRYQVKPAPPFTPGMEVAGSVRALGDGVGGFRVGDPVIGMVGIGGFAEVALCRADWALPRPATVEAPTAACFPVAYGTAHIGLEHRAGLRPGETLLVHGASGGVGLAAVEVGKAMGATVIATAGNEDKLAIARAHGADHGIDYGRGEFRHAVKALTGGGADVIFDPVGGDIFDQSLRCIAWEGRIVVVGFASGRIPHAPCNLLLVKNVGVLGVHWGNYRERAPQVMTASLDRLFAWLDRGLLKPLVSRTFPLEGAADALRELRARRAAGKLVVVP